MKTRLVCSAPIPECDSFPSSRSSSTTSQSVLGGSKGDDEEREYDKVEKLEIPRSRGQNGKLSHLYFSVIVWECRRRDLVSCMPSIKL